MRRIFALTGFAALLLSGCASEPAADQSLAGDTARVPTPKACKARGLIFTRDANGTGYCVTEAQARCQQSALLVLGDSDCLNSLMWKDDTSRPAPLPPGTAATPKQP